MDDSQIISLFLERSEQAITELSNKYGALCGRVAQNILHNQRDAEECVNEAYLAVWNTVPPRMPDPLSSYVCRIVRNLAVKQYHANTAAKRNSQYDVALDEVEACFPSARSVEQEADARQAAQALNRFLATLDRDSRVLFVRRYWYAASTEELAELLHISRHAVVIRLSRIRKKLKQYLYKEGVFL
ncbi:MAG: sigma-70 family RNA polymerase sigma factor [Clostridia bacterium]|nr:sigma-70 family RNA polymerase sigma factor [Clostridia bacterium]